MTEKSKVKAHLDQAPSPGLLGLRYCLAFEHSSHPSRWRCSRVFIVYWRA